MFNLQVHAQANRYVAPDDSGNDIGNCSGAANPCATIQYAIDQADPGDIIRLENGVYTGPITVNKTLSIIGANPEFYTVVQGLQEYTPVSANVTVVTITGSGTVLILENVGIRFGSSNTAGGIIVNSGTELEMTNGAVFLNRGSGILVLNNGPVNLTNVVITENEATNGAGIHNTSGGTNAIITIDDCRIEDNTATNVGGGIYLSPFTRLVIHNTIIRNNSAVNSGGGIHVGGGQVDILDNTRFIGNSARFGGAINTTATTDLTINDAVFRENRTVSDPVVNSNRGGAIYHSGRTFNIFDTHFEENESAHEGGAIYTDKGGNIADSRFINNKATMFPASSGGAIRMLHNEVDMSDVQFTGNESAIGSAISILQTNLTLDRGEFRGNSSSSGSVHVVAGQFNARNSLFTGNYSSIGCAVLCLGNSGSANLVNATIASNYTSGSMTASTGAIQTSQTSQLSLANSIIWQNYNSSGIPQQIYTGTGVDVTFYNTLVEGGINGEAVVTGFDAVVVDMGGNVDGDPQFLIPITASNAPLTTGNFNIKPQSPARDSGLNTANNSHFDLARNSRIIGTTIDMGAYEYTGSIKSVMYDFAQSNVDVPFPDFNLRLRFAGVTEEAPVRLSLERFEGGLENAEFNSGEEPVGIADARWVLTKLDGDFSEATIGLTGADTLMIGLQPERVRIYKRSEVGIGLFEAQETSWDSELKILSTQITSLSEFIIGDPGDPVSINDGTHDNLPAEFSLGQNYPNPFNPSTQIRFGLPEASDVRIEVFDITGRTVVIAAQGSYQPGYHSVAFNAGALASGLYLYRLQAGEISITRKMLLIK